MPRVRRSDRSPRRPARLQQAQDAAGGAAGKPRAPQGRSPIRLARLRRVPRTPPRARSRTQGQDLNITDAARQKAEELGVDLSQVEGTGAEGRITVRT